MSWPIERYLNVRQAYGATFAADGDRIAFLTTITGLPQVWQVELDSACASVPWPDQMTFEADRVMAAHFSPAPGDPRLLYTRDVGGNERHQLFLLSPEEAEVRALSAGHENAMHLFGDWSGDGERICFGANRRDPGIFDLYVQDLTGDGGAKLVWENDTPGYLAHIELAPDGQRAILSRTTSSFDHTLLEIDLVSGQAMPLLASEEPVRYLTMHYAPGGDELYLITDLDADFLYVARLDLQSGELDKLVAPVWDCGALALSRDGTKLAYTVNVDGADHIHVLDLTTWQTQMLPGLGDVPGVVTDSALAFSPDGARLAFSFTSATRTADLYLWDLTQQETAKAVQAITRSSHGGLPVSSFVTPALIQFPTFDDVAEEADEPESRRIPAWFFKPPSDTGEPVPVVVMVHGGPESQFRPGFHFLIQYLLHHGYGVLAPNVRGSTGYGKRYSHLDDVEKRMDSVADLAHAAAWLKAQPEVDGDRLVVYGGSYGGFMVLAAVTTYPDLWAAAVDIVGISNLATFLENTSDYRRAHREAEYGALARDRDFLERIAPINHVDQISAPLMVIHGANDPRVPLSEAEQLVAALEQREVPVRFLVFDDEGHGVVKLRNKLVAYPAIIEFLDQYVGNDNVN